MENAVKPGFTLKGWHVLAGFVAAFGVIITVNVVMATQAVRTFPGLEVANSYVASQEFDTRRAAQERLGWTIYADDANGWVHLRITDRAGQPVRAKELQAVVGRATVRSADVAPAFAWNGSYYEAPLELAGGKWDVRINATADDGTAFTQRVILHVTR
ncbi:nitrogen fixation protein FixH [Pseudooceanicola sediminis]|uniref:Nitrogen fixation protein FixH n=1 Tax=Pseudooceanicola sediminis TaxID=2211117 RepID=A0A399IXK3_9RHOB|nr:FixH family protein [Pseudooceanicola sediminis]KAA2312910.1 FixH family protein [Puniceibacterium sp. HSS470]RII37690.1 nitrogen fixation protein FixH [Pseudooceanicola sediminis]|tara:strand:+ start:40101 stop:40574 length:474 start_codon:yes stop_codon:yes gene_type:complete